MLQTSHILEMAKRLREMRMPPNVETLVDSLAEKVAEEGTDELVKQYKKDTPGEGKEVEEATTGDKEEYQRKRKEITKKFGVTSCSQLEGEKKKACYAALDAAHVADHEEEFVPEDKRYVKYEITKSDIKTRGPWMVKLHKKNGKVETSFAKTKSQATNDAEAYMKMKEEVEIEEGIRDFKVGDKVKFVNDDSEFHGQTGKITSLSGDGIKQKATVKLNKGGKSATNILVKVDLIKEEVEIGEAKRKSKKDYEIYHKTYSGAVQHAADVAKRQGYEVDQDSWDSEITHGQRKPSEGKTVIKKIKLTKDGKPQKKMLQIQVHGMKTQYELNMYIESAGNPYDMVRKLKGRLDEEEKGVTNIKRGYLTHVKEFPAKMQAGIKKVISGVRLVEHSIKPRSEPGKTIPGLGLILPGYKEPTIMIQWNERVGANPSRVPAIARGKWKSPEGDEGDEEGYDPKKHGLNEFIVWINEAASAKGSPEIGKIDPYSGKGKVDWYPRQYYSESKRVVQYLKTKVKRGVTKKEEIEIGEKIDLAKSKMGDVVKDFQDSDAPQFKGKSDKKRREMAIAAKLDADRKEEYGQEDKPKSKRKDKINLKPKMDETMKTLKDIRTPEKTKVDEAITEPLQERPEFSNFIPFNRKFYETLAKKAKKAGLKWETFEKYVKGTFLNGGDKGKALLFGKDVFKESVVKEAVTELGVEYEESDFDGPHRLDAAYPNLNTNFAKYMEEDLEGPYEVSGEVYFYDRKVGMFYSVSGEDFVDEETGKELVYRLHKNGMYKIELGR